MAAPADQASSKHFVLVHGVCVGGWAWFKVATRLRDAGHRVSTPDLAASGVDPRPLREVPTFRDYSKPLLDLLLSVPPGEKVVLVGHSFGGVSIALACELFPEKVAAAVFVSAFMPDHRSPPSYVLEKYKKRRMDWMDMEFKPQDPEGKLPISIRFGPLVTRAKFYQLCSPEDLTLGRSLMRVGSMFVDDLKLQPPYTEARYGSVRKVFIVLKDDNAIFEGFQRWMVQNYPVDEVREIHGADHMALLSTPDELARCLADVAVKYAA
ncbi:salicylic acid-binding protein 2 [Aegilops tauschii subsp. strangulata]|uniref:AB hydrolase-1 domain-containing protein n=7 Tax=Aegilops tauschii subsp. strangulata TaxID=200361 RepID=A0A453IX68_AEGTS|nr:salicylic acid-binding protein 2 [Aegilops tauschii subsp. strangulata]